MEANTVTTAPQTTQKPKIIRAKHWAGCTLPNYTEEDLKAFKKMEPLVDYYIYGRETGANGLKHLQFMVCFKKQVTLSAAKKLLPTQGHWEVKSPKSTMERASNYCKKGEQTKEEWNEWHEDGPNYMKGCDFTYYGTLPLDQKVAGLKAIADVYADTIAKAKEGRINDIIPEHQLRYYSTIKKIQADAKKMPENLTWTEGHQPNFWIWGETRTGKSHLAREMLGGKFYSKNAANKWWDKYDGEENVLIEDIDKGHNYQGFYLKIWADKYAFPVEIKNGGDLIRPKIIIVTSNYPIEEVFPDPAIHKPLLERFKVIHKAQKWNAVINDTLVKQTKGFQTKKISLKKRKYDQPLKKPALFKQNAEGKIVPNNNKQMIIDEMPLNKTQEIEKEKEIIELMDSDDEHQFGTCDNCGHHVIDCYCYQNESFDIEYDSMDDKIDSACFSDESEDSDDLFDI